MSTYNTGNPIGSTDPRDLYDNAQNLDNAVNSTAQTWTDRFGISRSTVKQMLDYAKQFNDRGAWQTATAYARKDFFTYNGVAYVTLTAHTSTSVASDLAAGKIGVFSGSAAAIDFNRGDTGSVTRTALAKLGDIYHANDYGSEAAYKTARAGKVSIDASNRIFAPYVVAGTKSFGSPGDTWPGTPGLRDAFTVSRDLQGLTDCHAFADKTVIDQVTDYGGYGTFDATTICHGSHTQNHVFSFQDRTNYTGSGVLQNQNGLYSAPSVTGSGKINNRFAVSIHDVGVSGGGSVDQQVGVMINDLAAATANAGINVQQTTGYAIYAPGTGQNLLRGNTAIGFTPPATDVTLYVVGDNIANHAALNVTNTNGYAIYNASGNNTFLGNVGIGGNAESTFSVKASGGVTQFFTTDATGAYAGVLGNNYYRIVNNGGIRLEVTPSGDTYTVRPGVDNSQPLGDVTRRWSAVYAGTGTIQTSDERQKQQVRMADAAEKRVAAKIKASMRAFKFNDAVEKKGDAARIHFGTIAQAVKAAFEEENLNPNMYALFCYDAWDAEFEEVEATAADKDAYAKEVTKEKLIAKTITSKTIEIRDGVAIEVSKDEIVEATEMAKYPLFNEDGTPKVMLKKAAVPPVIDDEGNIVRDEIPAEYEQLMHEVPVTEVVTKYFKKVKVKDAGNSYGIRYDELFAFLIAAGEV